MSEETRSQEQELSEILQIRREKLAALQEEGRDPFKLTRFVRSAWSAEIKADYEQFEGKTVQVAGRIMSKRGMGKAIFCHIKDDRGQLQLYVRSDAVSAQEFADFRNTTSAISSEFRAMCSRPRPRRSASTSRALRCCPRVCARCRRSSTA